MNTNYVCINDSVSYRLEEYPEISESLDEFCDICSVEKTSFKFKFTGIIIINNIPTIIFPKNYCIPENQEDLVKQAGVILRVFLRYRNEPFHEIEETKLLYGDNGKSSKIVTAIQLMDDYRKNGIIKRDRKVLSLNKKGRIDWISTINKTSSIYTHNSIIYDRPIMHSSIIDSKNTVQLIHQYVVNECIHVWGWLFGYGNETSLREMQLPFSLYKSIDYLRKELKVTYIQREINVIKLLIEYLTLIGGNQKKLKREIIGTQYFSYVWEAVCGYLFNNKYSLLKELVPQPKWESDIVASRISQRPDVFFVQKEYLVIIDAKYYNYHNSLPGWHDVVKQFFYYYTISKAPNKKKQRFLSKIKYIRNVFIFPGDSVENLQYIGKVSVEDMKELDTINAYAINQVKALETYAYRNNENYKNALCEELISSLSAKSAH